MSALYETASADEEQAWRKLLGAHQEQLREWAENYPPTFADKHALVRPRSPASKGETPMPCACTSRPFARPASMVSCRTKAWPMRWRPGSTRRAASRHRRRLSAQRQGLLSSLGRRRQGAAARSALSAFGRCGGTASCADIGSAVQQLDVASVVKASQALSSEIVLPRLIERLMKIAIENAGADRGLLILPSGDEF